MKYIRHNPRRTDIDSIEIRLFDRRGNQLFSYKKAPGNIITGLEAMKKKGINLRELL